MILSSRTLCNRSPFRKDNMCFRIITTFSCQHKVVTTTICHDYRDEYEKGSDVRDCYEFLDHIWWDDFNCDECRDEKPVVLTKDRELPRLKRDESDVGDEEVEKEDDFEDDKDFESDHSLDEDKEVETGKEAEKKYNGQRVMEVERKGE